MRFDTLVNFYSESDRRYSPKEHGYTGEVELVGSYVANVTDIGTNRAAQLFGNYEQNSKVIRLIESPPKKWSFLLIGNDEKKYRLETLRQTSKMFTLICGEG